MQCSTGNLQCVVCKLCYVVLLCSSGELQFSLYELLNVVTEIHYRRNEFAMRELYYVLLLCSIGNLQCALCKLYCVTL